MEHKISNISKIYLCVIIITLLLHACKDEKEDIAIRNFAPIGLCVVQDNINKATIKWQAVKNAVSYTVQLSTDSTFNYKTDETTVSCDSSISTGLINGQIYYVRVRANNADSTLNSHWETTTFKFNRDNILYASEVGSDSVLLSWNKMIPSLSQIIISSTTDSIKYELTQIDISNQHTTIHGLKSGIPYTAKIYMGNILIGSSIFRTKSLSENDKDIYITNEDNLINVLNLASNGSSIHFGPGVYAYGDNDIEINNKSLVFESNETNADSFPEISVKSFTLKGHINKIIFKNLSLSGFALGGASPNKLNSYLIDLSDEFIDADTILIEGCAIHNLSNCVIRGSRGKGQQKVNYIGLKNCEISNINSTGANKYEMLKLDSLQLNSLELNNCTIYNTSHGLINNRNNYITDAKGSIINCTINDVGSTDSIPKKYLLDFSGNVGTYLLQNNIFSNLKGYSTSANSMSKGFLTDKSTINGYNNLFYNMPFTAAEVINWNNSDGNIDDVDPQYKDSNIGDFTIGNTLIKTAGKNGSCIGVEKWCK